MTEGVFTPDGAYDLITGLEAQGQLEAVVQLAGQVMAALPGDARFPALAAAAHLRMGQGNAALSAALAALSIDPFLAAAHAVVMQLAQAVPPDGQQVVRLHWLKACENAGLADVHAALRTRLGGAAASYDLFVAMSRLELALGHPDLAVEAFGGALTAELDLDQSAEAVTALYTGNSAEYDRAPNHQETATTFLDFLLPLLGECRLGTVADVACGTGLLAPGLRPRAARLLGLDLVPAMLDQAAAKGLYDELRCGDAVAALAAMPGEAEAVVSLGLPYFLQDIAPFLAGGAAALRPGGLLVFNDYPAPAGAGVMATTGGHKRYCRSADLLRAEAARAGLAEVACELAPIWGLPCHLWAFRK